MRKRVLNSRAGFESSPAGRFRGSEAIIPGSGGADPGKCDVKLFENDPKADAQKIEASGNLRLPSQPVDATHALNLSAGVSNSSVLRGRSFN
jgi:hypothetical protein